MCDMFKRNKTGLDIIIASLVASITAFLIYPLFFGAEQASTETVTESDTYEVVVTEEDETMVEENSEYATEGDTEAIEPSESEEGTNTEVLPPESEEGATDEAQAYWCEWLGVEISQEDYELLCRTTFCEAGGESMKTQVMVCLVILNQYGSNKFADTIHGVVYAKKAFSVTQWKDFEERTWNEKTEEAVQKALAENKHPKDMYYFRTGHYHKWAKNYKKVGSVYFSTHK